MERGGVNGVNHDRNKSGQESVETLETLAQQTDNNGAGENMENNNDRSVYLLLCKLRFKTQFHRTARKASSLKLGAT